MRPIDAYVLRRRLRGEIPARLSPEAEAVLRRELVPNNRTPEHPALAGLRHGFLSRRIVEHLLDVGEATAVEIALHFRMPKDTARSAIDNLVKGGRIRNVRTETIRHPGGQFTHNIYAAMDTEALLRDAVEGMAA